ncbi:uncharacterized protein PV06_11508 [Exophiala oligosperma]|uniref:Uncharacterized protein n=1 Tax=Exophiala oligosperma TaxID=215243 RepID=A0A0D2DKE3_9EURO|nr:uncharacterized protein PV06_11508 [Exophiala oligosperma]KIW36214.1 hypothetical protein PV06_11508 [Exophiala oligosperma]
MPQKRKRAWLVEDSRAHGRIKKQAEARKQREAYKLERTRALVEQGLTKYQLDERRDRYYCMKEHPARFCGQCNPRADVEDNEGLSDEEAGMSDSWSDDERDKVVKYIKGKIQAVDSAATRLKMFFDDPQAEKPPAVNYGANGHCIT